LGVPKNVRREGAKESEENEEGISGKKWQALMGLGGGSRGFYMFSYCSIAVLSFSSDLFFGLGLVPSR